MTIDLTAIREGLADVIRDGVDNVHVYSHDPWGSSGGAVYPCAIVRLGAINYHDTFNGSAGIALTVEVRTAGFGASDQRTLDELLSSGTGRSIVDAIEADATGLHGTVEPGDVTVVSSGEPSRIEVDGAVWQQVELLVMTSELRGV